GYRGCFLPPIPAFSFPRHSILLPKFCAPLNPHHSNSRPQSVAQCRILHPDKQLPKLLPLSAQRSARKWIFHYRLQILRVSKSSLWLLGGSNPTPHRSLLRQPRLSPNLPKCFARLPMPTRHF